MENIQLNAKAIMSGFRKTSNLTLQEVSEKVGTSKMTLIKYEKDPTKMPTYMIEKLEDIYGEEFTETFFKLKLYKKQ